MACSSCKGTRVLRGNQRTSAARTASSAGTTCKVVTMQGDCALLTENDECRVFTDVATATVAAQAELGPLGWTIAMVRI